MRSKTCIGMGCSLLLFLFFREVSSTRKSTQATAQRDQAEYQVSKTKRTATEQIKTFWQNYLGDKRQFDAFDYATDLAEKTYKEQVRQYRFGLVTNLDVLTALTNYIEDERSLDKARHAVQLDLENLEAAAAYREVPAGKM